MSYARFSDDDFQSDVYVYYADDDRWDLLARARHLVWDIELPPHVDPLEDLDGWAERTQRLIDLQAMPSTHHWVELELPTEYGWGVDDWFRIFDTPGDCAKHVALLKGTGFHVPDGVIEALLADQDKLDAVDPDFDPIDEEMS